MLPMILRISAGAGQITNVRGFHGTGNGPERAWE